MGQWEQDLAWELVGLVAGLVDLSYCSDQAGRLTGWAWEGRYACHGMNKLRLKSSGGGPGNCGDLEASGRFCEQLALRAPGLASMPHP